MRKSITTIVFAAASFVVSAVIAYAGGFFISLGNPDASTEARAHNAYVTLKMGGCGEPEKATVSGVAIGIAGSKRQTVDLKLIPLSQPGMYAVPRQWPKEGRWVLRFVARDHDRVTNTLVVAGPQGLERETARYAMKAPSDDDVAALLERTPNAKIARK